MMQSVGHNRWETNRTLSLGFNKLIEYCQKIRHFYSYKLLNLLGRPWQTYCTFLRKLYGVLYV